MPFLLAEILNFQGSTHHIGVGSFSILSMSDEDIIVNMAAELYKLNDINRQKNTTYRWALRSFAATLITIGVIYMLFLFSVV